MPAQAAAEATPTTEDRPGVTPGADGAGQEPRQESAHNDTIESLPEWAQRTIADLRKENAARRQANDEAKRKAAEEKLAAEQKWQELAEQRQQEIERLTATATRYSALSEMVRKQVDGEIAQWPDEVKSLRPAGDEVEAVIAWVEKARAVANKLKAAPPTPGQGAAPRPSGQGVAADQRAKSEFERVIRGL